MSFSWCVKSFFFSPSFSFQGHWVFTSCSCLSLVRACCTVHIFTCSYWQLMKTAKQFFPLQSHRLKKDIWFPWIINSSGHLNSSLFNSYYNVFLFYFYEWWLIVSGQNQGSLIIILTGSASGTGWSTLAPHGWLAHFRSAKPAHFVSHTDDFSDETIALKRQVGPLYLHHKDLSLVDAHRVYPHSTVTLISVLILRVGLHWLWCSNTREKSDTNTVDELLIVTQSNPRRYLDLATLHCW